MQAHPSRPAPTSNVGVPGFGHSTATACRTPCSACRRKAFGLGPETKPDLKRPNHQEIRPVPLSGTASFRWSEVRTTSVAASSVSSAVLMVTSWFKGSAAL